MKLAIAHRDRLVREALRRTLSRSDHELLWQAADRTELERECRRQPPALLLVELELLGRRAEHLPRLIEGGISVIALASSQAAGDGYEALGLGALGLIEPPRLDESGELIGGQRTLTRIQRLASLVGPAGIGSPAATAAPSTRQPPIIALGASTGGPLALAKVLASLPTDLQAAVLIVQHIESEFTSGLAEWLGSQSKLPVSVAERGDTPRAGRVYVAGSGGHLVLLPSLQFSRQAARASELHVPSVDALFTSLALHAAPGVAALLTGMGSDGVAGLGEMRRRGWHTLAQDERSSVVYGMPRAAMESGAAQQALDLAAIGPALVRQLAKGRA
ncbi:chemotaxis protein CheB [Arenimonas sp. MALMAid1274]|uniref:chemotaxis protein CheB n=1 Tax=Arenimonas sp. MALMAid1274 TaxID=3411630 RepID=UPI003BA04989